MEACLANEVDEVGGQAERRHLLSILSSVVWTWTGNEFIVGCLDLCHGLVLEAVQRFIAGLESRLVEAQPSCALAEAHCTESLKLCLIECIGEEGVCSVIGGESLLE